MRRELTPEDIEWLKENYPKLSDKKCLSHLHISTYRLWELAEKFGLKKDKPRKKNVDKPKKEQNIDGSLFNYCIDCTLYRYGGICQKSGKWVGALWQKECFTGEE